MVEGVGIRFLYLWILAQDIVDNRRKFDFSLFHMGYSAEF